MPSEEMPTEDMPTEDLPTEDLVETSKEVSRWDYSTR